MFLSAIDTRCISDVTTCLTPCDCRPFGHLWRLQFERLTTATLGDVNPPVFLTFNVIIRQVLNMQEATATHSGVSVRDVGTFVIPMASQIVCVAAANIFVSVTSGNTTGDPVKSSSQSIAFSNTKIIP